MRMKRNERVCNTPDFDKSVGRFYFGKISNHISKFFVVFTAFHSIMDVHMKFSDALGVTFEMNLYLDEFRRLNILVLTLLIKGECVHE